MDLTSTEALRHIAALRREAAAAREAGVYWVKRGWDLEGWIGQLACLSVGYSGKECDGSAPDCQVCELQRRIGLRL